MPCFPPCAQDPNLPQPARMEATKRVALVVMLHGHVATSVPGLAIRNRYSSLSKPHPQALFCLTYFFPYTSPKQPDGLQRSLPTSATCDSMIPISTPSHPLCQAVPDSAWFSLSHLSIFTLVLEASCVLFAHINAPSPALFSKPLSHCWGVDQIKHKCSAPPHPKQAHSETSKCLLLLLIKTQPNSFLVKELTASPLVSLKTSFHWVASIHSHLYYMPLWDFALFKCIYFLF